MSFGEFGDFLDASLRVLRSETPPAARRLSERLAGRSVRLDVAPAPLVLRVSPEGHRLDPATGRCSVSLALEREVILDLVEGRLSLAEAVLQERLRPRGGPADLGHFFDALTAYLEGAVRAPGFPRLYRAYRRGEPIPTDVQEGD
jgi:hypothetical protein